MYKALNVETNEEKQFSELEKSFDYIISNMQNCDYIRVFPLNGDLNFSCGVDEYNTPNILFKVIPVDEEPITSIPDGLFGTGYQA